MTTNGGGNRLLLWVVVDIIMVYDMYCGVHLRFCISIFCAGSVSDERARRPAFLFCLGGMYFSSNTALHKFLKVLLTPSEPSIYGWR